MPSAEMGAERTSSGSSAREFRHDLPWLLFLFVAVLWNLRHTLGSSPGVWVDTLIENLFVEDCLKHDRCTAVGAGATIGIFHSAGYFHWRSLLEWIGWKAEGTYLVFQIINALGVVLVGLTARRIGGRTAGAVGALLMSVSIGIPTQLDVISDVVPMPFLGAVFAITALTATTNPSLGMSATMGLVAGVAANCYSTGLLLGLSGVFIALMLPERRLQHALVTGLVFGVSTFAIAPYTWLVDSRIVFTRTVSNANAVEVHHAYQIPLVILTAVGALLWAIAWIVRLPQRRQLHVMAAIVLPLLLILLTGSIRGRLDPQPKYVAHVLAAACVCLAAPAVELLRRGWELAMRTRPQLSHYAVVGTNLLAPYATIFAIASGMSESLKPLRDLDIPPFTYADLAAAEQTLTHDHGWAWQKAARNLKTVDETVRRASIRWVPDWSLQGASDNAERAFLVKVPTPMIPRPLPANVKEVLQTATGTTLLGLTCSWLDWSSFRVCVKEENGEEKCEDSGWPADPEGHSDYAKEVPGMPNMIGASMNRRVMTLHLPIKPRPECPESWFYMPRQPGICPGTIVSIDGSTSSIEEGGRWARLKAKDDGSPHEIAMQWELGGAKCAVEYRGYPPFFVEGDARFAAFLATLIERQKEFQ